MASQPESEKMMVLAVGRSCVGWVELSDTGRIQGAGEGQETTSGAF